MSVIAYHTGRIHASEPYKAIVMRLSPRNRLENARDDATVLELSYRLSLHEDFCTAHDARIIDFPSFHSTNAATTPLMPFALVFCYFDRDELKR